jgi:hypothetical protein
VAKTCEGCGFYTDDNAPTSCPACGAGLRFTLLPPAGAEPAEAIDLPPGPARRRAARRSAPPAGTGGPVAGRGVRFVGLVVMLIGFVAAKVYVADLFRAAREEHDTEEVVRKAREAVDRANQAPTHPRRARRPRPADDDGEAVPADAPVVHPSERLIARPGSRP